MASKERLFVVNGPGELDFVTALTRYDTVVFTLANNPNTRSGVPYECIILSSTFLRTDATAEYRELKLQNRTRTPLDPQEMLTIHYSRRSRKGVVVKVEEAKTYLELYRDFPEADPVLFQ